MQLLVKQEVHYLQKTEIYTGISMEAKCNLGNCGEHAAIIEMLKNNESEIEKIVAYSAKGQIYAPCGRCRELIRMVNDKNLNTKVMVAEDKVCELMDLLPEMYISKQNIKEQNQGVENGKNSYFK